MSHCHTPRKSTIDTPHILVHVTTNSNFMKASFKLSSRYHCFKSCLSLTFLMRFSSSCDLGDSLLMTRSLWSDRQIDYIPLLLFVTLSSANQTLTIFLMYVIQPFYAVSKSLLKYQTIQNTLLSFCQIQKCFLLLITF